MRANTPTQSVWMIGDPHFGIDFKTGVPLHRRGEREVMQLAQFKEELATDCDVNVTVGDLFDKPFVPFSVIFAVANAYLEAAQKRPQTMFIIQAGNHDLSRQLTQQGAFDLLALILEATPNIIVAREPTAYKDIVVFPWEWKGTAAAQVQYAPTGYMAIGHWDLSEEWGSGHLVPVSLLKDKGFVEIYSGHYHVAGVYRVGGVDVHCVGSMQPYTHAEDPEDSLYITLSLDDLEKIDPAALHDMNVRVVLPKGVAAPELDCLSLTLKREDAEYEMELDEVGLGDFDLMKTLAQKFAEYNVPGTVQGFIRERLGVRS